MVTKNAFSIMISKYSLVYQIAFVLIIAFIIFGIIGYAILTPTLSGVVGELKELNIDDVLKEYLSSVFKGVDETDTPSQVEGMTVEYQKLVEVLRQAMTIVRSNLGAIWGSIIAVFALIVLFAIFYYICLYTVTDIMNAFMSSDSEYGFISNLVANLSRSIKFSLAYVGMSLLCIIFSIALSFGIGFLVGAWNNFFGIVIAYFIGILCLSIKRALFAGWMPAYVVSELTVKESLIVNFKMAQKYFRDALGVYFMIYLVSIVLAVIVSIITLGIGMIIVVAVCTVLAQAYDMVNYYHYEGKKYYRDAQHVVDPTKKYKDAVLDNPIDKI